MSRVTLIIAPISFLGGLTTPSIAEKSREARQMTPLSSFRAEGANHLTRSTAVWTLGSP
jgi:hypothetical protein